MTNQSQNAPWESGDNDKKRCPVKSNGTALIPVPQQATGSRPEAEPAACAWLFDFGAKPGSGRIACRGSLHTKKIHKPARRSNIDLPEKIIRNRSQRAGILLNNAKFEI